MTHYILRVLAMAVLAVLSGCAAPSSIAPPPVSVQSLSLRVALEREPEMSAALAALEVRESPAEITLRRVNEAREFCGAEDLAPQPRQGPVRIYLCGWSEMQQSWRLVPVVFTNNGRDQRFVAVDGEECEVQYRGGTGLVRFHVDVYCDGEKLTVYRSRHYLSSLGQTVGYTPYHPDMHDRELAAAGMSFLEELIREAKRDLRRRNVGSKAFPGRMVGSVHYDDIILALAAIEQADHDQFDADERSTIEASYINYALNRDRAFTFVCSYAGACGPMQFMPGTYRFVRGAYPTAGLDEQFSKGARNQKNAVTAAILLLDLELSYLPYRVRLFFERHPTLAGAFLAAAYNGGAGAAKALYEHMQRELIPLERINAVSLPSEYLIPKETRNGRRYVYRNTQSPFFVRKYLFTIGVIEEWRDVHSERA